MGRSPAPATAPSTRARSGRSCSWSRWAPIRAMHGSDARCDYVLAHAQAPNGGFGWSATNSTVVHCLNGNLLRALLVVRRARRSARARGRSTGRRGRDHRRGHGALAPVRDERTRVRVRDQRQAPVRLGSDQGGPRARRRSRPRRTDTTCVREALDTGRRVPARARPRDGRLPGGLEGQPELVAFRVPARLRRRRAAGARGARRAGSRTRPAARAGGRSGAAQAGRPTAAGRTSTAYRGKLWANTPTRHGRRANGSRSGPAEPSRAPCDAASLDSRAMAELPEELRARPPRRPRAGAHRHPHARRLPAAQGRARGAHDGRPRRHHGEDQGRARARRPHGERRVSRGQGRAGPDGVADPQDPAHAPRPRHRRGAAEPPTPSVPACS